jgi:polygalacturonase
MHVMLKKQRLLFILCLLLVQSTYAQVYNIKKYGAVADSKTINTKAIQQAIDLCSKTGGQVLIPQGTFVSGTLHMKSNVELHVNKGGVLKGSPSFKNYPDNRVYFENAFTHDTKGKSFANKAFIFAEGLTNISFTGAGTIDGSGDSPEFDLGNDDTPQSRLRPCMLLIVNCKNVKVTDLTMSNSAYWMQNYLGCDGLKLQRLTIYNQSNYNQDGIDIDARNVLVENCKIDVDDDGICFKSHNRTRIVENVVVRNCTIGSNCNAIKFGTMSIGGLKNVSISNCTIKKASADHIRHWQRSLQFIGLPATVISGIALESVDGAEVENITIANINMTDVQTPIFIVLGNRGRKPVGDKSFYDTTSNAAVKNVDAAGHIKHILIKDVTAISYSKMTSSITAFPGRYVEDVELRNISLNNMGEGRLAEAAITLPENPGAYPENRMYGQVYPASGLFIRHVKGIKITNLKSVVRKPDYRPVLLLNDVHSAVITDPNLQAPAGGAAVVALFSSKNIAIDRPVLSRTQGPLIRISQMPVQEVRVSGFNNYTGWLMVD